MPSKWTTAPIDNRRNQDLDKKTHISSGQLAKQFTNKKGLDAYIDKENMKEEEKKKLARFGSGTTRFAILNNDGSADPEAVFESDGIIFRPNTKGHFYAANEAFLEEELKREEQIRQYVKRVLKYCVNDEVNMHIFGLNDFGLYKKIFGPTDSSSISTECGIVMDNDIAQLNCMASYMESLLPDSASFHASTQKLIQLVRHFMPMIRGKHETREQSEGEGKETPFKSPTE